MEYSKGKIIEGKIIHVTEEYLLVKFPNKETGILHKSKITPQPENDLTDLYRRNQSILVSIDRISEKGYTLGRKDIENRYENQLRHEAKELDKQKRAEEREHMKALVEKYASQFERGGIYEAEVISLSNQGAKIKVYGIDGYIKKDDLNWNENDSVKESLFEGEIIHAVFLEHTDGKLLFGLKYLDERPYDENLYDLSLSDLLKYAGHYSNVFIGQAKMSGNFAFIENLYSCDKNQKGKLLIDPIYGYNLKAVVINQFEEQIIDGEYYKVKLSRLVDKIKRFERNQLFQFTAEIIYKVDNPYKKDVESAFKKLTSPAGNVAIAHLLKEVVGNMLAAKDRMFFELVQNADDAASQNGVRIKVKTEDDFLIVSHNGVSFDKDDFNAIVSAANGTKKTDENKTGYKGIGFKTVFKEANRVFIKTGGYQFKFDKSDTRFTDFDSFYFSVNDLRTKEQQQTFLANCMGERNKFNGVDDIPWQLEPIWVDAFPESLGRNFTKPNVSIALEIGKHKIEGEEGYCQAIEGIINNPKFMLFLRNTNRIDFNDKSVSKLIKDGEIILKNSFDESRLERFKIHDYKVKIGKIEERSLGFRQNIIEQNNEGKIIEANFVDNTNHIIDNIPSKIALNESTTISFAIPIDKNGAFEPIDENNTNKLNDKVISIFAFLPTLVKEFDFTVFVNANFLLTPDRQHILGDNPWNYFLMEELAYKFVDLAAYLCLKEDKNALKVLRRYYFNHQTPDVKQLAEHFNNAYKSALESEAFILNHKGELAKQEDIIIDKTSLSEIVGTDLFCKLLQTEKCLPSEKIDSKILKEDIFEEIELMELDDVVDAITNNEEFNEWFVSATNEQKNTLYKWIDDNDIPSRKDDLRTFVSNLPLFQFGEEYKSCEEISSSYYIVTTEHIEPIKGILSKLGFVCSDNVFDENHSLYTYIKLQDEDDLFNSIKDCDFSELSTDERRTLFFSLADFNGVGDAKLKDIALFRNINGATKPLGEMVAYRDNTPSWLSAYVLCKEDNDTELSDYLISQEDEFKNIVQEHIGEIDAPITEIYKIYKDKWTGQFTRQIIDKQEVDNNILTIIEDSNTTTKEHFLNSIHKLELHSSSTYKKDSYEYRVLQLALSIYDEPSDFSSKIYFDNQCIKDFSVSDDVVCEYTQNGETKKVKMSLAKLLPQYQNQSDSIDKIKALFETKKDLGKFFETESKSVYDVHKELNQYLGIPESYYSKWNVNGNVQQFLFATYYRRQKKGWNNLYVPKIDLNNETDEFVYELLDFLFDNSISIEESPFTYHLKVYFIDKYFDSDYVFDNEQLLPIIEKWADNDKKIKYLKDNRVQTSECNAIQFRKLFLEDKPISFIDKLSDGDIKSGIEFVATASGFERPFVGENQKNTLLSLKDKCNYLKDKWDYKKMEDNSKEWDSKEYKEWFENHYPKVFIYPGMLPSQLSYNDELLLNYDDSECDYHYNKQEKKLFISNARKTEDILFEVAKEGSSGLDFDDYKELCLDGKVSVSKEDIEEKDKTIKTLEESNRKKDEIIENLQAKLKAYEKYGVGYDEKSYLKSPSPTIAVGEPGGVGDKSQWEAQLEAQKRLIQEFPQWTFPSDYGKADDNGKPYNFSTIEIKDENGNTIPIVLKSYKKTSEPFKINTEEWDYLIKEQAVLLIYTGADVKRVYVRDLIRKQSSIAITFSTENLDIEDKVNAFADSLHYFNELHFDFDSFNISSRVQSAAELYKRNKRAFFANDNTEDDI